MVITTQRRCTVIGTGRAGASFHRALSQVGWHVESCSGRATAAQPHGAVTFEADLILVAVPDAAIGAVANAIGPLDAVVAHVSGACGLDVVSPHVRVGSLHPLMSLPDARTGAARLLDTCVFAVDGDPMLLDVVASLGGTAIMVSAEQRTLYHATATIAANHLTALCAQVERLAAQFGVPVEAYWKLMGTTMENIERVGARAALTGPAVRGDWETVDAHLQALDDPDDRQLYLVLCRHAALLGGHELPDRFTHEL